MITDYAFPQKAEEHLLALETIEDSVAQARIDPSGTVAWLLEIVELHPHPILRHEAAFMLGELQAQAALGDEVAEVLCRVATIDCSVLVRHEATEALWNFDSPAVGSALARLIGDSDSDIAATAEMSLFRRQSRLARSLNT